MAFLAKRREREQSFPSSIQSRTSSSSSPWSTTGTTAHQPETPLSSRIQRTSLGTEKLPEGNSVGGHPLRSDWHIYFSHRSSTSTNSKNKKVTEEVNKSITAPEKEKLARDEWSTSVVKLGGFSTIEGLHPFMAHLTPPSLLPASLPSTHAIFHPDSLEPPPPNSAFISDINIFRSPIAPIWEDVANVGGGRWVLRLRKGVADRVWEEIVWALVGERIGSDSLENGDSLGSASKVNGVVLSVRKDEDILSIWCKPAKRPEREIIRDSIRLALEPLLSPAASAALTLDFKAHPNPNPSNAVPLTAASLSPSTPNSNGHHRESTTGSGGSGRPSRNGFASYSGKNEEGSPLRETSDRFNGNRSSDRSTSTPVRSSSSSWGRSN